MDFRALNAASTEATWLEAVAEFTSANAALSSSPSRRVGDKLGAVERLGTYVSSHSANKDSMLSDIGKPS
jgi:hypothetical protein